MDIHKVISLFGKEYRDNKLVEFFKKDGLDVVKEVQNWMQTTTYKDMESDVYAEYKDNGYYLICEDELDFFDIEDGKYGESGNYYFVDIGFYGKNTKGYMQYKGELINGINLLDSKEELRKKMGTNYKRHDFLDVDIWENINGIKVFVDYKKKNTPETISLSLVK